MLPFIGIGRWQLAILLGTRAIIDNELNNFFTTGNYTYMEDLDPKKNTLVYALAGGLRGWP